MCDGLQFAAATAAAAAASAAATQRCRWPICATTSYTPYAAYRHLLEPQKDADGFFTNGRATW